jgi:hypothetical protein
MLVSSDTVRIDNVQPQTRGRGKSIAIASSKAGIAFPLTVWFIHLLLTQIPATLAYQFGTLRSFPGPGPESSAWQTPLGSLEGLTHWIVEPFRHWDGTWYRWVAVDGYDPGHSANAAFWPLYPWLMELGSELTGWSVLTIGYLISNAAFLGALIVLYRLVSYDFNEPVARRTLWALALFPTAFFFTAIYTESLFLFLAVSALFAARKGDWLLAGIVGFFAALTRSAGLMLLLPFAVLLIQQHGWNPRRWFPQAIPAALPALGPVIFGWFLRSRGLGFFDWADQQWQWNRFSATPWRTFECALRGCIADVRAFGDTRESYYVKPIDWGWIGEAFGNLNWTFLTSTQFRYRVGESHVLEFLVTVLAIALVLIGLRKLPLYYSAFVIPPLIVPLLTPSSVNPLMSMPRFVLPLFPLFVVVALLVKDRRLGVPIAVVSSLLLIVLTMQFAQWYWVS